MANLSSIARPYALAAFEFAKEEKQLSEWKIFLDTAAMIVNDPNMRPLLTHPEQIGREKLHHLFEDILVSLLDKKKKNFLTLLSQNQRLILLPQIAEAFNNFYATYEKTYAVKLVTAVPVDEDYQQKISHLLTKRFHHHVALTAEIDPSIIAGAMLYIGDKVIDASVRGKLSRLLEFSLR